MQNNMQIKKNMEKIANIILVRYLVEIVLMLLFIAFIENEEFTDFLKMSGIFMFISWLIFFSILFSIKYMNKDHRKTVYRRMSKSALLGGIGGIIIAQILANIIIEILKVILHNIGYTLQDSLINDISKMQSVSIILFTCIVGPVFEEILFRDIILNLLKILGNKSAIIISSILFGIYHGNIEQAIYAILIGIILGYVATEISLYWAMVFHIFNNSMAEIVSRINSIELKVVVFLLFVIICFGAIIIYWKKREKILIFIEEEIQWKKCLLSKKFIFVAAVLTIFALFQIERI